MPEWMKLIDELGPEKIVSVYDPVVGAMTHKFAILDIPLGGAKAGIWADPGIRGASRGAVLRAFGKAVKPLLEAGLILGADMGTDAEDVVTIYEGAGVLSTSTGLARQKKDGEPLEDHATGYGVVVAAEAACEFSGMELKGATVAIEGFGKVGGGVARYMAEEGAKVVAISTIHGTTFSEDGLDIKRLLDARRRSGDWAVERYEDAQHMEREAIYHLPVDVLVPGARPYVIDKDNATGVQAKVISSTANIPISDEAEEILFQRGIHSVPDFISNAGGVLLGIVDVLGGTADDVFRALREFIGPLTCDMLAGAHKEGMSPRRLAVRKTREKVLEARGGTEPVLTLEDLLNLARQRLGLLARPELFQVCLQPQTPPSGLGLACSTIAVLSGKDRVRICSP